MYVNDIRAQEVDVMVLLARGGQWQQVFRHTLTVNANRGPWEPEHLSVSACFPLLKANVNATPCVQQPSHLRSGACGRRAIDELRQLESAFDPAPLHKEEEIINMMEFLPFRSMPSMARVNKSFCVASMKSNFADRFQDISSSLLKERSATFKVGEVNKEGMVFCTFGMNDPPPKNDHHVFYFLKGTICVDVKDVQSKPEATKPGLAFVPPSRAGNNAQKTTSKTIDASNFSNVLKAHNAPENQPASRSPASGSATRQQGEAQAVAPEKIGIDEKDVEYFSAVDSSNPTQLLFTAIDKRGCPVSTLETLVQRRADVNAQRGDKQTPMHIAAYFNNVVAGRWLLAHGAKPSLRIVDQWNTTPYDKAKNHAKAFSDMLNEVAPQKKTCSVM